MATLAAGAPLLAGGPPGWALYAALGVVTLGVAAYGAYEMGKANAKQKEESKVRDDALETSSTAQCREWSVRVHAQGDIIGGTSKSTIGAPPVLNPKPITVAQGLGLSTATFALLEKRQAKVLAPAKANLDKWVSHLPPNGYLGKKSFYPQGKETEGGNRFDLDSFGCTPNFVS